jgi:hypothetical protein
MNIQMLAATACMLISTGHSLKMEANVHVHNDLKKELDTCLSTKVNKEELPGHDSEEEDIKLSHFGNQGPYTRSGQILFCLGRVDAFNISSAAVYFFGYSGRGGAYCLSQGLSHSKKPSWSLAVPEADKDRLAFARGQLKEHGQHINFLGGWVPDDKEWVKQNICPQGLDLMAFDIDHPTVDHLWQNAIEVCKPTFMFIENVGMYPWVNPAEVQDTWHQHTLVMMEDARQGKGDYDLVVDTEAGLLSQVEETRYHSLMVRKS